MEAPVAGGSQGEGGSWGWGLAAPPMALGWGPCGRVTLSLPGRHAGAGSEPSPGLGAAWGPQHQHVWSQFAAPHTPRHGCHTPAHLCAQPHAGTLGVCRGCTHTPQA